METTPEFHPRKVLRQNPTPLSIIYLLLSIIICLSSCSSNHSFFIAIDGDDSNAGTRDQPWATPYKAQEMARVWLADNPGKNITIYFREGTYSLNQPLLLNELDQGNNESEVIWASWRDEKVNISGGRSIDGWKVEANGLWTVELPDSVTIEQLYVNHSRAVRARIPNADETIQRWPIKKVDPERDPETGQLEKIVVQLNTVEDDWDSVTDIDNIGSCELVVFKDWAILRKQILEVIPSRGELIMAPPYALFEGNYNSLFAPYVNRYNGYLEGSPAFIDQPGEWAMNQQTHILYYMPKDGETPSNTEVIIPLLPTLLKINGQQMSPAKNIHFRNLTFSHAAYLLPEYGHDGRQACFYYPGTTGLSNDQALIDNAIELTRTTGCSFEQCTFTQLGSTAISIGEGCEDNQIIDCKIFDFGGNGIMIGMAHDPGNDTLALPKRNLVENCSIQMGGLHFQSAVGIWLGFTSGCRIDHNELYNLPYTGISVGWQWNPLPTSSKDNYITNNNIHHVMQMLGDGGGIYTLGFQPGSVISGNQIHDVLRSELNHASPNNGMFIDEGSKGYLIENNTIYRTAHTCIRGHRAAGVTLRGNTFVYGDLPAISHTPPYENMILVNIDTTVSWQNPGWPAEWGYSDHIDAFYMENNTFIPLSDW